MKTMKTLFILSFLLSSLLVKAQDCEQFMNAMPQTYWIQKNLDELKIQGYVPGEREVEFDITWQLLLDYADECSKDSIYETVEGLFIFSPAYPGGYMNYHQIKKPRTPTFEGFIEYLRKKYFKP